jgi:hypothetical protein
LLDALKASKRACSARPMLTTSVVQLVVTVPGTMILELPLMSTQSSAL